MKRIKGVLEEVPVYMQYFQHQRMQQFIVTQLLKTLPKHYAKYIRIYYP